ncbi:MAG: (2Fe-2S)-binding protein [Pseudomonadota bacterium]
MRHSIIVNNQEQTVDVASHTPLLWVLRDQLQLMGTKYGCGVSQCGACTVHVDGEAVRSCVYPISAVEGARITTIEGLSPTSDHAVQKAWIEKQVPQCGYCQSGMIMAAAALLAQNPRPTEEDIRRDLTNICRCGTYSDIVEAIRSVAEEPSND